jgi:hypothetical protein
MNNRKHTRRKKKNKNNKNISKIYNLLLLIIIIIILILMNKLSTKLLFKLHTKINIITINNIKSN